MATKKKNRNSSESNTVFKKALANYINCLHPDKKQELYEALKS